METKKKQERVFPQDEEEKLCDTTNKRQELESAQVRGASTELRQRDIVQENAELRCNNGDISQRLNNNISEKEKGL